MVAKKKLKWVGAFLLISIFSGCFHTLKINDKRCSLLSRENVEIEVTAKYDMRFFYVLIIESKRGSIEVHPKELRLISIPTADTIRINGFYFEKKAMKQSFILNQGETVECKFTLLPDIQKGVIIDEIQILPCDFITHQGIPLINDTISIIR